MMNRILAAAFVGSLLVACGPGKGTPTQYSTAYLCSSQVVPNPDGTVTTASCAFYQHIDNITRYGTALSTAGLPLQDGTGGAVGQVTTACGAWLLGTDPSGLQVVYNQDTGEVESHGTLHAGQPLSSLPSTLVLPLKVIK